MSACAEAFGYTPAEFYALTLPQLAAFSRHFESQAARAEGRSAPPSRPASSGTSIDTLDDLILAFGSPESKAALRERMTGHARL